MTCQNETRFLDFIRRFLDRGFGVHVFVLVCAGLLIYCNAIFHPFVHDDVVFILQNPNIARWDNLADAFLRPSIPQFFEGLVTPYYRPILEVLYRVQYAVFGFNAHGFHLVNVLIHIANAILIYSLIPVLIKDRALAFVLALIFLVHPVQTQAVACVSGISNLVCAFFLLMTFNLYVRVSRMEDTARRFWFLVWIVMGYALALLSKEQAVVFPLICLAYECLRNDKSKFFNGTTRLLAIVIPFAGYLLLRHLLFGSFVSAIFENTEELKLRLLALPGTLAMYTGLVVWPVELHYYRSTDILAPFIPGWIFFGLTLAVIYWLMKRWGADDKRHGFFGLIWFVLALLPVLNIIPLVNEYSFVAAAEHNLYFPIIGFLIFVGTGGKYFATRWSTVVRERWAVVILVLFVVFGFATFNQNRNWQNEIVLFKRALQFEPQLGRVHILLAKAYLKDGRIDEAIREFEIAAQIMEEYMRKATSLKAKRFYAGMLKGIYAENAQAYANKQDFKTSIDQYNKALAFDPRDSFLYSNRALSLIATGNMDSGILDLQKALKLNSDNLFAANNLSICYIQKGERAKAKQLLQEILRKDPGFQAARDNLNELDSAQMNH